MKIDFPLAVLTQANLISNRNIVPVPSFIPEIACTIDDPVFNEYWSRVSSWTYLDPYKAKNVWDLALEALKIEGDFIECGSHLGGLGFLLGFLIRHFKADKRVYLCDSFQGMPEPDPLFDSYYQKGMLRSDLDRCRDFIKKNDLQLTSILMPGWFEETLPTFSKEQKFSLIHIDCDIYQSTLTCFENLYDKANPRSPIIMDDFFIPPAGERMAAMQWLSETGETLNMGPLSQVYVRKDVDAREESWLVEDAEGLTISLQELSRNAPYQAFLEGVRERSLRELHNLSNLLGSLSGKNNVGDIDQKPKKV